MSVTNSLNNTTVVVDPTTLKVPTAAQKDNSTLDKDSFLKLMIAQLKNQSPDSPVDTNSFMQQTAQMTQLETLQNMQKSQDLSRVADQSALGTSMIGKSITATNALGGADIVGTVTGVKLGTDGPVLKIGDTEVALSAVKEVNTPTAAAPAASTTTTTAN